MSIRVMAKVWDTSSHERSELLCLLAIADHCDDEGVSWPSIPRLAQKARVTERYIRKLTQALVNSGELFIQIGRGRGNSNRYLITLGLNRAEIIQTLHKHSQFRYSKKDAEYITDNDILKKRNQSPLFAKGEPGFREKGNQGSEEKGNQGSHEPSVHEPSLEPVMGAGAPGNPPKPKIAKEKPIPVNLGGWLTGLKNERNKVAYLVFAYETLYPNAPSLDYGKMGALKNRVGGGEQMLRYMYEFSGKDLTDPITYIVAAHNGRIGKKKPQRQDERSDTNDVGASTDDDSIEQQYQQSLNRSGFG